jgi:hypothetical protein
MGKKPREAALPDHGRILVRRRAGSAARSKPVAGVELGFVTDRIWAAFVERHRLALETGSDQQVRQIFRARRLLAGWVDGIEADQLGGEIDGTK